MITESKMFENDYDWFCILNDIPICVSSAGRPIPNIINRDNYVVKMIHLVKSLESIYDFEVNSDFIARNLTTQGYEYLDDPSSPYRELMRPDEFVFREKNYPLVVYYYSEYFAKIARKGFYVFNGDINKDGEFAYHLISWPRKNDNVIINHYTPERVKLNRSLLRLKTVEDFIFEPKEMVNIDIFGIVENSFEVDNDY